MDERPVPPPPAGPEAYGAPPPVPEGYMLTPSGQEPCLGEANGEFDTIAEFTTPIDVDANSVVSILPGIGLIWNFRVV